MGTSQVVGSLPNGTTVYASSVADGRDQLAVVDAFVQNQSRFDRQARLCLLDEVDVTLEMYLSYVSSQVLAWTDVEIDRLKAIFAGDIALRLERFRDEFALPGTIHLVKTTGQEEGNAAYTRRMNVVALPANMVMSLFANVSFGDPLHEGGSDEYLADVIVHEFFHIFSKNNPERRAELYRLVDFNETPEPVMLPDVQWPAGTGVMMRDLKITNPDTPVFNSYIELDPDTGSPADPAKRRPLLPILLASSIYKGGSFFDYLQWLFMEIHEVGGSWVARLDSSGQPITYPSAPLEQRYLNRVGRNITHELFHPDELLAQNWVLVSKEPSLDLLDKMTTLLETPPTP